MAEKPKHYTRSLLIVYAVLRILVVGVMIRQFFLGNYNAIFICILTLILFMLPTVVERGLNINLPNALEVVILLFIFAAEILGEINTYYLRVPHWDTMLHVMNGFLMAAIGFAMIDILNQSERFHIKMSPLFVALVSFCFSMTIGVVWEFFEFSCDQILHTDMQKDTWISAPASVDWVPDGRNVAVTIPIESVVITAKDQTVYTYNRYLDIGLHDTMKDLMVNCLGAIVFSIVGLLYIKGRAPGAVIMENLVPTRMSEQQIAEAAQEREHIRQLRKKRRKRK